MGPMLPPGRCSARILVVDDERCYRVYLAHCLRARGYTIHMSTCAPEALSVWEQEGGFDLVVTDLQMPGMTGLELRDELLRRRPDARVLVMTAGGAQQSGVVSKPESHHGLVAAVEAALGMRADVGGSAEPLA